MGNCKMIPSLIIAACCLSDSLTAQDRIQAQALARLSSPSEFLQIPIQNLEQRFSALPEQTVLSPLVRPAVEAAEKALQKTFDLEIDRLEAAAPFTLNGDDVLIARWRLPAKQQRVRSAGVWDSPRFTTFVLECDTEPFSSLASSRDYLSGLIRWSAFFDLTVNLFWNADSLSVKGSGKTTLSASPAGHEFGILGKQTEKGYLLLVGCGKRFFSELYSKELMYVPERFPPLHARLPQFTRGQLFAALDRETNVTNPYEGLDNRDYFVIVELLRRGVTDAEYSQILLPAKLHSHLLTSRLERVLRATGEAGQLLKYSEAIRQAVSALGAKPNDYESQQLVAIFFQDLRRWPDVDLGDVACTLLAIRQFSRLSLGYLEGRGHTGAHYACVERAELPPELEGAKEQARREIKARLNK